MEETAPPDRASHRQSDGARASDLRAAQIQRETRQLRQALVEAEAELAAACQLQADFAELSLAASELQDANAELKRRCEELEAQRGQLQAQRDQLQAQRDQLATAQDELLARYRTVTGSSSWTWTAPLRRAMSAVRGDGEQRR